MKFKKIIFSLLVLIFSISMYKYINREYNHYKNFKKEINLISHFVALNIIGNPYDLNNFDRKNPKSEALMGFLNQNIPLNIGNGEFKYYVTYDSAKKVGYVYISDNNKEIKKFHFNKKTKTGIYVELKDNFFVEYLTTMNKSAIIGSFKKNENRS